MVFQKKILREFWWAGRMGHSIYLTIFLGFVNFILIAYRLLIERVTFFKDLVPELWIFALMFILVYVPAAILIGYWHRRTQLRVETTIINQQNPILAKMIRTLLDVQTGVASKEEIKEFRDMLKSIERKHLN